jgi:hypothetical protein
MLNDAHKLHAIEIYLQCFQQTLENNALLDLFCYLVDEPCFDQLRTKEQLGYIVSSSVRRSRGVQGFRVIIQSSHELDYVNQRIELFIDTIRDYIATMPDELFRKQREGYVVKKMEIPKKMHSQTNKFWNEITNHQFCFDRRKNKHINFTMKNLFLVAKIEVEIIKGLERTDLLRFYDYYISPRSIHRRKLSLHVDPSSLAQINAIKAVQSEDDLAAMIGQELPSIADAEIPVTVGISHEAVKLTEQPPIVDLLTEAKSKEPEKILPKTELDLPKVNLIFHQFFFFTFVFYFNRPNGLIMFMYGKVNCHVIHWLNRTKKSMYLFSVNYKTMRLIFHHLNAFFSPFFKRSCDL